MNDVQKTLCKLLREADSAFSNKGIRYSLVDRLAWDAVKFGRFHDSTYEAVLIARYEDSGEILAALRGSGIANRAALMNDGPLGSQFIVYADTDTTLLDLNEPDEPLVPSVSLTIKLAVSAGAEKMEYLSPQNKSVVLPDGFFLDFDAYAFEGVKYPVSKCCSLLFEVIVGKDWKKMKWPHPIKRKRFGVIANTLVPSSSFIETARDRGLLDSETRSKWRSFDPWFSKVYEPAKAQISKNNYVLGIFEERYRLWDKYIGSKDLLMSNWQSGRKMAVELALDDYLEVLKKYYRRLKVAICFDFELFEIAATILESQGFVTVEMLSAAIPAGHKDPIVI